MGAIDFFNTLDLLEPKCPRCESKIEYGVTTDWDDGKKCHICKGCGEQLKENQC